MHESKRKRQERLYLFAVNATPQALINNAMIHDRGWFHYRRGQLVVAVEPIMKGHRNGS
jgi:hypothetical protein